MILHAPSRHKRYLRRRPRGTIPINSLSSREFNHSLYLLRPLVIKEVEQCLIRGIGDSSIPDWCILHDLIDHEGKLSDAGLIHIWGQVQEKERVREKHADFNSFQKWWRTEEGKDKYVLQPQHDYPRCLCSFCDNKIKTIVMT